MKTVLTYAWRAALICYLLDLVGHLPLGKAASGSDWMAALIAGLVLSLDQVVTGLVLGSLVGAFVAWRRRRQAQNWHNAAK